MDRNDKDLLILGGGAAGGTAAVVAAEKMRQASIAAQKQRDLAARAKVLVNGERSPAKPPLDFKINGVVYPKSSAMSLAPENTVEIPAPSKGVVMPKVNVGGSLPPASTTTPTVESIPYVSRTVPPDYNPLAKPAPSAPAPSAPAPSAPAPSAPTTPPSVGAVPSKVMRFLAGGAVPTLAGNFASTLNDPAVRTGTLQAASDKQIQQLAEDDPVGAQITFGKDRVTQAMAAPPKTITTVTYGKRSTEGFRPHSTPKSTKPTPTPAAPATLQTSAEKFKSDQAVLGREDLNAPGQTESGTYRGTNTPTNEASSAFRNQRQSVYNDAQTNVMAAQDAASRAQEEQRLSGGRINNTAEAAQRLKAAEAANETARQRVVSGQGPLEQVIYARENGRASGIREVGASRGYLSGADTDAEAARNLKARAEQDQAARFMVDSMNRGAEAERDTRAARLGVSRGVLDRMEGRDTPAGRASLAGQTAPDTSAPGVWDRPGDGFGDAQMREAQFNSLLDEAGNQKGLGSKRRAAAKLQAAAMQLQPGISAVEADTANRKGLSDQQTAQINALAEQQKAQMQEAGQDRRVRMNQEGQLMNTDLSNRWGAERDVRKEQASADIKGAELFMGGQKEVNDLWNKAFFGDGKTPPLTTPSEVQSVLNNLDPSFLASRKAGTVEDLARLRNGQFRSADEVRKVLALVQDYKRSQPAWYNPFGSPADVNDLLLGTPGARAQYQATQPQ